MVDSIQITFSRLLKQSLGQTIQDFCDELGIESPF